jgi:hypothetical protein
MKHASRQLFATGKRLENGRNLSDYTIQNGWVVSFVVSVNDDIPRDQQRLISFQPTRG